MTESRSLELCQVLFFGHRADRTEVHTLRGGVWQTEVDGPSPRPDSGPSSRFVAIEVADTSRLQERLEERLVDLEEGGFCGCYLVLPDRPSAELVSQMLVARSFGPFQLYGVDPDYYHGIVPLGGHNHRRIEAFVLGLKPTAGFTAKARHWVKRALIGMGRSSRLYEGFVIVLEEPSC